MQILLVFSIEDPFIVTLKNSILRCGYSVKCCRNIHETHEAFKKLNYDLVFIDCRRGRSPSTGGGGGGGSGGGGSTSTNNPIPTITATTATGSSNISSLSSSTSSTSQYDYANICQFIRKLYHYTVIIALTHNYDDKNTPSVLPLLKIGFSRTFAETTSLNRCINELLNLENGEVSSVRRLQAAHALFTALEYTNDPIEIMNDQFKLVYVNNAFEKLTGFSLNDMSGREFNEFHRLVEPSQQLNNKKLSPGNAWECSRLPFPKLSGELAHHLSITIPVIVQGETNKIQNYVTITYLPERPLPSFKGLKRPQSMYSQSEYAIAAAAAGSVGTSGDSSSRSQESTPLRKPSSFALPKKSYDFDRFATVSLASTSDLEPRTPPLAPSQSITDSIDETGGGTGSQFYLDQEPSTTTTTTDAATTNTKLPTLLTNPSLDFTSTNNNNNLIQRKRSYDIQSSYGAGQVQHNQGNMLGGVNYEARRNSSTHRLHHQPSAIEAPIRKVINFITVALERSNKDFVKQNLENALDILKSTELYNPSMVLDSTSDMHTSDLVSGLMSNGLQRKFQKMSVFEIRQHSFNSASSLSQHNYVKNLTPEINEILQNEESWNFDIIALERLTNHRPLVTLGFKIFNRFDVCEYLKIEETVLVNWLTLMESNYRQTNPYHNSTHASDVLHATAYFLSTNRITEIFEAEDRVGSLIAAVIHDLNHPGRTNAFLCNSNNDLAILYNDQAVLENHHAALAFQLTRQNDDTNIFKNLTREEYRAVRSVIIDMVLATEMSKHFEHLNKFMNKFNDEKAPVNVKNNLELLKQQDNKVLIKRILIKCADVNNPCRPLDICQEWANRIAHEYFDQTDEEKAKSLPVVMPTFDRVSCNIPKAQISFIEYFITDMFDAWDDFVDISEVMLNLSANTSYWRECRDEQEQKQGGGGGESNSSNSGSGSRAVGTLDRSKSIAEDNEIDQ